MNLRQTLSAACVAGCVAMAGCGGGDDDSDAPEAPTGPNAAYLTQVGGLCTEALDSRELLQEPTVGKTGELAEYFRRTLEIQARFRAAAKRVKPPAALAADQKLALRLERRLADTLAGYERVARGGDRRFIEVVRQLQDEANPQIERLNDVFERMGLDACEAEPLEKLD